MPDRLKRMTDPVKARWVSLTRPQQYKLVGVIVVVLIALILVAYFAFRTRYMVLVNNSSVMELTPMVNALNQEGIRNRTTNGWTVLEVDARRRDAAVGVIHQHNAAPPSDHFGWADAFDATGLGTTDSERTRMHHLALESQIADSYTAQNGVSHARVTLNIPATRPFERDAAMPSASIVLTTTRDFSHHEGMNLALIATSAVNNLLLENVHIIDHNSRTIFSGHTDVRHDESDIAMAAREQLRNRTDADLRQLLSLMFDDVRVSLSYEFEDRLFTEEIIDVFTPSDNHDGGIPHQSHIQRSRIEGGQDPFEPGLGTNQAAMPSYMMPLSGVMNADHREEIHSYFVNHTQIITRTGPGWVRWDDSSVGVVVVNRHTVRQENWMNDVPEGEDPRTQVDWEMFRDNGSNHGRRLNGEEFPDYEYLVALISAASGIPSERVTLVAYVRYNFIDIEPTGLDIPLLVMLGVLLLLLLLLAVALLRRQKQAEEEDMEPELSVEDLLVSTQLEEAREEAAAELEEIDYFKENEIKKHIEKFVNEKPEAVAALLRNWINVEEW